ncbi:SAM-dependent methyltransferase, partial [Pseudomonas sp. GP01-A3]
TGAAGWTIIDEKTITSPDLQDGKWEVYKTIEDIDIELSKINDMPAKLKELILSEMKMLNDSIKSNGIKPLSIFAFVAE